MTNAAYAAEVQKLGIGAEVTLYEIDLTKQGGGIERFVPMSDPDNGTLGSTVSFGNEVYYPFPIIADGFDWKTNSAPSRPTCSISNIDHAMTGYVLQYDSLIGAEFRRIRTFEKFLDGEAFADGDAHQPIDQFRFDRKPLHNETQITWEMASWIDQQGVYLPRRTVIRDYCDLEYRTVKDGVFQYAKATCPYTGSAMFNANGQPVTVVGQDVCPHTLNACKLRHPRQPRPFGGFPGAAKYRV